MPTLALLCPPLSGHLNPMLSLGSELQRRGHRVVVPHLPDFRAPVERAGPAFHPVGEREFPIGTIAAWQYALQKRGRFGAVLFTIQLATRFTRVMLRDGPPLLRGVNGLLVDQIEFTGATLAEWAGLPHVTIANAFPINREPTVPSAFSSWRPAETAFERMRDRVVCALEELNFRHSPIGRTLNKARRTFGLKPYRLESEHYSSLAQLSQCPEAFDYPRKQRPQVWHGVGPLRASTDLEVPFPFERLDGRPLVYASMGTLQGARRDVFAAIAEACAPLGVQLVITHGNQLRMEETRGFAGNPLVVPYAPQRALLQRAALAITHAGMNTVLDALDAGVPLLTIPITFEQPAIAARVVWHGAGEVVPLWRVTVPRLHEAAHKLLHEPRYREASRALGLKIANTGGVLAAADVVERAFGHVA